MDQIEEVDENGDPIETLEQANEKKNIKSQKSVNRKSGKRATSIFSMRSLDDGNIAEDDILTYIKMKKLKTLFNVSKASINISRFCFKKSNFN